MAFGRRGQTTDQYLEGGVAFAAGEMTFRAF
jgi:hypothetical protein